MKFVYKIYSGFDGFTPRRIEDRMLPKNRLALGWARYLDSVERGMEVWIYFRGPHKFTDGVYARGTVAEIDFENESVILTVREYSEEDPITDPSATALAAGLVAARYRQVFVLPEEIDFGVALASEAPAQARRIRPVECSIATDAESCAAHHCAGCATWATFPLADGGSMWWPPDLDEGFEDYVAGYWVIPTRCYWSRYSIKSGIRRTSELFYRFKTGEENLAFPLALAIHNAMNPDAEPFNCIVPIPLSPEKIKKKELHRTLALADALSSLLGVPVVEGLTLTESISKRRLMAAGVGKAGFRQKYLNALDVQSLNDARRILLVDDVCTRGTTLSTALERIAADCPDVEVSAACAGQMILKDVVKKERAVLAS